MISHEIIKVKPSRKAAWYETRPDPVFLPELKVGDLVYYNYTKAPMTVDSYQCSVVMYIETNPAEYRHGPQGGAAPYLLMGLTGTTDFNRNQVNTTSYPPYIRWTDGTNITILTEERKQGILDDFVQDYIKKHTPTALAHCQGNCTS
jgi:hypothetical protein